MLQDPNVERYVENAINPLKKEIQKLKLQIEKLNKALRIHDVSGQVCQFFFCSNTGGKCDKCGKEQCQH